MNGYSLLKSFRMFRYHWRRHLFIFLQMALGITAIYAALTVFHSIEQKYISMKSDAKNMMWNIQMVSYRPTKDPPITLEEYRRLKRSHPEFIVPFHVVSPVHYAREKGDGIEEGVIYYATEDFLRTYLNINVPDFEMGRVAYVGPQLRKALQGDYFVIQQFPPSAEIKQGHWMQGDYKVLSVRDIGGLVGSGNGMIEIEKGKPIPTEKIALVPFGVYQPFFTPEDVGRFRLSMVAEQGDMSDVDVPSAVMQVMEELEIRHGAFYSYNVGTFLQRFLLEIGVVQQTAMIVAVIASLSLVIVMIGLLSLILLFYRQRIRGIAVSAAIGASKGALFREFLIEATFPSLLGGVLGTVIGSFYLKYFIHFGGFEIRLLPVHMIFAIGLSLIPGLLTALVVYVHILRLRPLEILRKE